jgi:sulfate transport system substrate-binding protein
MRVFRLVASLMTVALSLAGCGTGASAPPDTPAGNSVSPTSVQLLNVSYDPTRELWAQLNAAFRPEWKQRSGQELEIRMSHAGSTSQARSVIEGLDADVATLAMATDTAAIETAGLIEKGWEEQLPNGSLPYSSTIVFVVRKGNPKQIRDWPDLTKDDVSIITPNPKTSGNGKLSFYAAWGSTVLRGGSDDDAKEFVRQLYKRTPVLESGARGATVTFAQKKLGDVHLTWENEAHLEVAESQGALELVYPKISIRAEPRVAIVDANVDRKGTREVAQAYLEFLYSPAAQEIIANNHYRPYLPEVLSAHEADFPAIELFSIKQIAGSWREAEDKFFSEGAVFDQIFEEGR